MSELALQLIRQAKADGSTTLDLGRTGLTELPEELFELEQLETLIISNDYWDFEKRDWIDSVNRGGKNHLKGKLPDGLARLQNLKQLYIGAGRGSWGLTDIQVLGALLNLTTLDISDNKTIQDYAVLEKLSNLQILDLGYNDIGKIGVLEKLSKLFKLKLSDNQISDIRGLEKLTNLTSLYLSDNQISDIRGLEKLTNLTSLYLSSNKQIKDFSVLEKLTNLTSLDLRSNQISDLSILQSLPKLEEVNAVGNPIQKIPKSLIEEYNCLPHLRAWWAETADAANTQPNRTVKLMLTGNSNTGKSTLVHALKEGKCAEDKKSTDGIQLEQWEYVEDEKAVQFCIWDFGGQEIFHGTHRLFLSSEAIQLILFDPETEQLAEANKPTPNRLRIEEDNRNLPLPYWIETIQELSPDSKILIVQNKIDVFPAKYRPARQLLGDFESIEEIKYVSAWTGKGIKALQCALHQNAIDLHEYEMPMPKSWLAVQQYFLDNLNQDEPERVLSYAEFEHRCREVYGVLEISIPSLLTLLHHNGVVYYNKQYLEDTIIADQRWALDAIYKPLHHESDFYEYMREDWFGKVRVKHIFEAFGSNYKTEEKWLFLNLMRSCALCFPLKEHENQEKEDENTRYIFPEFLSAEVPDAVQATLALHKANLHYYHRQYDYLNYYRIQTFIASLGQKTQLKYIWRNGILIETADGIFVVEADYENNALLISIEKSAIKRWLYEIIQELEEEDKLQEVAAFWSISQDKEHYNTLDLVDIRNRAVHKLSRDEEKEMEEEQEKKSLAEQLPDVAKPLETKKLVVSYAREDRWAIEALKKHLSGLRQSHQIEYWHDQKLDGRQWWDDEIEHEFNTADGYIVFVSPHYVDEEVKRYIHQKEIPTMCRRKNEARIPIYSITVTSVDYGPTVGQFDFFADKQAIPREEEKQGEFLYRFVEEVIKRKFLQL